MRVNEVCFLVAFLAGTFGQEKDVGPEKTLNISNNEDIIISEINTISKEKPNTNVINEVNNNNTLNDKGIPNAIIPTFTNITSERQKPVQDLITVKLLEAKENGIDYSDINLQKQFTYKNQTGMKTYSVDFHFKKKFIFYAAQDKIFREDNITRYSTGDAEVILDKGLDGPVSIAVDWVNDKLYWLSARQNTLESSSMDGTDRILLIDSFVNTAYPNNVAVDPYEGYIFLVSNHTIFSASLDGKFLSDIQPKGSEGRAVKHLALDTHKKRIYYTGKVGHFDKGQPYVASCDYGGDDVQDVQIPKSNDIFSLSVFRDTLYYAHYPKTGGDTVWSLDLTDKSLEPKEVYSANSTDEGVWSIKVYHPGVQEQTP